MTSFSLCKTFIIQYLYPSTREYKWQDISCTPHTHKCTCSPVAGHSLNPSEQWFKSPRWCKGDWAEAPFWLSSARASNPCALLPAIWVLFVPNHFGRAAKRTALHLWNGAIQGPNTHSHPAHGRLRDMSLCRTDRQRNLSHCQLSASAAMPQPSLHFPSGSAPLLPAGVRSEAGAAAPGAARSQRGGASHGRMPRMPERAAPTVRVTALKTLKRGYLWVWILPPKDKLLHGYRSHARSLSCQTSSPPSLALSPSPSTFFSPQTCYIKGENENIYDNHSLTILMQAVGKETCKPSALTVQAETHSRPHKSSIWEITLD